MIDLLSGIGWVLMIAGAVFLITGAVGLVRLPDLPTRLHAVTKADTVGLGLVVAGLACHVDNGRAIATLLLIWLLVMASGAVACQLLARYHLTDTPADPTTPTMEYYPDNDDR